MGPYLVGIEYTLKYSWMEDRVRIKSRSVLFLRGVSISNPQSVATAATVSNGINRIILQSRPCHGACFALHQPRDQTNHDARQETYLRPWRKRWSRRLCFWEKSCKLQDTNWSVTVLSGAEHNYGGQIFRWAGRPGRAAEKGGRRA